MVMVIQVILMLGDAVFDGNGDGILTHHATRFSSNNKQPFLSWLQYLTAKLSTSRNSVSATHANTVREFFFANKQMGYLHMVEEGGMPRPARTKKCHRDVQTVI